MERHGLWAKKTLGQHFLVSQPAVASIVGCLDGIRGVLEIGPGPGVLTGPVSEAAERTVALEVDPRMLSALAESAPKAEARVSDVLKTDIGAVLCELPAPRAVVSNMPYHITGPLITRIAEVRRHFDKAVLMMQKEVADRIMAPPGRSDRGSLSVYLEAQFGVRRVCQVPAGAFFPPPKVDSTVLELVPRETGLSESEERSFFGFVRPGFRAPRKTLANNLGGIAPRERLVAAFERCGLKPSVRPHELTLEQWLRLWAELAGGA